jgi:hypothetical protein
MANGLPVHEVPGSENRCAWAVVEVGGREVKCAIGANGNVVIGVVTIDDGVGEGLGCCVDGVAGKATKE